MASKSNKQPDKHRAAIYARVSTAAQAEADRISLPKQIKDCLRRANADGFDVPNDLIFQETGSGADATRPQFQAMLEQAEAGRFAVLYVWAIDRFGRKMFDTIDALRRLKQASVELRSGSEPELQDEALLGLFIGLAEREHRKIRERTLPAKLAKRDRGEHVTGLPPYGYRKVDGTNRLTQAPKEAWVVRKIFDLCNAGMGRVAIARELNETPGAYTPEIKVEIDGRVRRVRPGWILEEHDTIGDYLKDSSARVLPADRMPEWSSRSVARILDNRSSHGVHVTKDGNEINLQIDGPPIITRSVFDQARRLRSDRYRKGRAPNKWLLVGKIECSTCGSSYIHHEGKGKHYYACAGRRSGKGCESPHIPLIAADREVLNTLISRLGETFSNPDSVRREFESRLRTERREIDGSIAAQRKKLTRAKNAWKKLQDESRAALQAGILESLPDLKDTLRESDAKVQKLERQIADLQTRQGYAARNIGWDENSISRTASDIIKALDTLTYDQELPASHPEMKRIIDEMVGEVIALPDRSIEIHLAEGIEVDARVFDLIAQTEMQFRESEQAVARSLERQRLSEPGEA